jgi:hypothetical protein
MSPFILFKKKFKDLPWAFAEPSPCMYRFGPWIDQQELGQYADHSLSEDIR